MQIFSFEIIFATSIKHTTKIMLLVDTAKYHNYKIINTMEKQIEKLKSELQSANQKVERLEAENAKVSELLDKTIKSLEIATESLKESEKDINGLRTRKDELLSSWSRECTKNKELKESLKAVATLINTILA